MRIGTPGWWRTTWALLALTLAGSAIGLALGGGDRAGGAGAASAAATPQTKPNIFVLMTDDQTVEDLAVMPRTRRLIGAAAATFRSSYVAYPLCCPSRTTLITGQYAHNHGVLGNKPPDGGSRAFTNRSNAAARLAATGRVSHAPHRQVPQRLRPRRGGHGPTGLERVVRVDRPLDVPDVGDTP